jgi:AraC family ethanolamine operon transcriptional activator
MKPQTFASFDEYAASLGHADLRLTALGRQRQPWAMCCEVLDDIRVRWARDGGPCLFETAIDADGVGLAIGINAAGKISGNGAFFGAHSVMVIPAHTEIRSVSLDAVGWYSVFIPSSHLRSPQSQSDESPGIPAGVINPLTGEGKGFRQVLCRVARAAMAGAFDSNPLGKSAAKLQLIDAARQLLWSPTSSEHIHLAGRHRISRDDILCRTEEFWESHRDEPVALHGLAEAVGVSDRTLHNAFREEFGVSPKRFLRLRALNAARRELLQANSNETRVTDVAAKLGIWEWGRFARDYRALFGELPSQTLRRDA